MSSTRLPEKVLKPLLGAPMLLRQIERVRRSRLIDRLIVATSIDMSDNPIRDLCVREGIECFRGDLEDVLDRFYQAASHTVQTICPAKDGDTPHHIVRLTGDCPLSDPLVIDEIIQFHLDGDYDYTSNTIPPTFPDGLDVEVFRFSALVEAWRDASLPSQREHVTPFIYQQPDRFSLGNYRHEEDFSHMRWTVDEPADFVFVTQVYEKLYLTNPEFSMAEILQLLDLNPNLKKLNTQFQRNEAFLKSIAKENALSTK